MYPALTACFQPWCIHVVRCHEFFDVCFAADLEDSCGDEGAVIRAFLLRLFLGGKTFLAAWNHGHSGDKTGRVKTILRRPLCPTGISRLSRNGLFFYRKIENRPVDHFANFPGTPGNRFR